MRIVTGLLVAALIAAWAPAAATAQECDPDVCANPWSNQDKAAKAKHGKHVKPTKYMKTKKHKKPAKVEYLRVAR
jgi:hypothetical protein